MYADRRPGAGLNKTGLAGALAINGAVIAALVTAVPAVREHLPVPPLPIEMIPLDPPPPPEPPQPQPRPPRDARTIPDRVDATVRPLPLPADDGVALPPYPPLPPMPPQPSDGGGSATATPDPAPPVTIDAAVDPAAPFQPDYPPSERRAENEGVVRIRVLIGADGRVKQAQRIEAASDAFWRATERQALSRWRFRPATRDGAPIEQWRTFTVRFRLEN